MFIFALFIFLSAIVGLFMIGFIMGTKTARLAGVQSGALHTRLMFLGLLKTIPLVVVLGAILMAPAMIDQGRLPNLSDLLAVVVVFVLKGSPVWVSSYFFAYWISQRSNVKGSMWYIKQDKA